jgi:nitroreductase
MSPQPNLALSHKLKDTVDAPQVPAPARVRGGQGLGKYLRGYRLKMALKRVKARARLWMLRHVQSRPRLASLYYAVFDDSLSREAAGVAAGRVRYRNDTRGSNASYFLLRRNIHRLEKGLIMRPRRPVFAADYLAETIDVYARAIGHGEGITIEEHRWARDVLHAYFEAVETSHPDIAAQWRRFQSIDANDVAQPSSSPRIPYARDLAQPSPVDFDSFMALSMRRRSVRWYEDRPVPRELVDRAISAAAQAPSACNRQPFVYRIFDDPERARRLAAIPLGTKGFGDKLMAVVVLVGRLRAYPEARDRHAIYVDGGLSAMAFMYALETLGLSSCPINWPDVQPQERMIAKELGLEPDERVIMLIAYGWPDPTGMVPFSSKREHLQIRQYN